MSKKHRWPRSFPYVMSEERRASRLARVESDHTLRRQVEEYMGVNWLDLSDADKINAVREWERAVLQPATRSQPHTHVIEEEA